VRQSERDRDGARVSVCFASERREREEEERRGKRKIAHITWCISTFKFFIRVGNRGVLISICGGNGANSARVMCSGRRSYFIFLDAPVFVCVFVCV